MNLENQSLHDFLNAVGEKSPTPGGGAVCSITAALGAALARMVVNYSLGKKSLAGHQNLLEESLPQLQQLQQQSLNLARADAEAYAQLNKLWKLDKNDPHRIEHWAAAVTAAIDAPRQVVSCMLDFLNKLKSLACCTNPHLASDLAIAAILADAATRSAAWNIRINLPLVSDDSVRGEYDHSLIRDLQLSADLCQEIELACTPTL